MIRGSKHCIFGEGKMASFRLIVCFIAIVLWASVVGAADLVRLVRGKLSAADLASAIAAVEDYKRDTGMDGEYWNAVGWLARGAEMLGRFDLAQEYVTALRRAIPIETEEHLTALGAAIEVESRLRLKSEGRGSALQFLHQEMARAKDTSLKSRISKNINLISLEGSAAPEITSKDWLSGKSTSLAVLKGKPVLVFLWAHWCGDCTAQSIPLARVWEKYRSKGLALVAPTRLYGTVDEKPATPAEERAQIEKVWNTAYTGMKDVVVPIDNGTMVRYGASATPTFVLIDKSGIVRYYSPTRLPEQELSSRIDRLLSE